MAERTMLMLTYAFPPVASSGTFRVARFAKYLPEFGWRPIVVAARADHAIYNRVDPSLARLVPTNIVVEVTAVLRPLTTARKWFDIVFSQRTANGSTDVMRHNVAGKRQMPVVRDLIGTLVATPDRHVGWILPAVTTSLALIRKYCPQVIFSSGPPHSAHLAAMILKQLTHLPVVCDLRDPWARNPWETNDGIFQANAQVMLERLCVREADALVLNTDNARNDFSSFYAGKSHGRFTVIANGYDPGLAPHESNADSLHRSTRADDTIRLCHCGSVYGNRSLLPLVSAIEKLKASGRRFELRQVGVVAANRELTAYIGKHDLGAEVHLEGELSHDEAMERMAEVDILVVIQGKTSLQVPAKLFEMLPFRKPILALTESGPTAEIMRRYNLGLVVDPINPDAIATAIVHLATDSRDVGEQAGAHQALRDFDGRRLTSELADVLCSCIQ